jgi:deoxyadenosine/deoxycytidine kinase
MIYYLYTATALIALLSYIINKPETIIISIDGNIGSGKSTMLEYLEAYLGNYIYKKRCLFSIKYDIVYVKEPVDEWLNICDEKKNTILDCFYKDNTKYAYLFQNLAFITRYTSIINKINKNKNQIIIVERTTETDRNVFAKMLYDSKNISTLEWNVYNFWYDSLTINIDKYIYIDTNVENCVKRIQKRNRKSEMSIPEEYLENLQKYHNDWMTSIEPCYLKVINGNNDYLCEDKLLRSTLNKIKQFIIN